MTVFGTDYPTKDGTNVRDYIHVEDLADAHIAAMEKLNEGEPIFCNLGTGNGFSVKEIIKTAEKVTGKKVPRDVRPPPCRATRSPSMPTRRGRSSCSGGKRSTKTRRRSSARRGTGSANTRGGIAGEPIGCAQLQRKVDRLVNESMNRSFAALTVLIGFFASIGVAADVHPLDAGVVRPTLIFPGSMERTTHSPNTHRRRSS